MGGRGGSVCAGTARGGEIAWFLFFVFLLELISFCYTLEEDGARRRETHVCSNQGLRCVFSELLAWRGNIAVTFIHVRDSPFFLEGYGFCEKCLPTWFCILCFCLIRVFCASIQICLFYGFCDELNIYHSLRMGNGKGSLKFNCKVKSSVIRLRFIFTVIFHIHTELKHIPFDVFHDTNVSPN